MTKQFERVGVRHLPVPAKLLVQEQAGLEGALAVIRIDKASPELSGCTIGKEYYGSVFVRKPEWAGSDSVPPDAVVFVDDEGDHVLTATGFDGKADFTIVKYIPANEFENTWEPTNRFDEGFEVFDLPLEICMVFDLVRAEKLVTVRVDESSETKLPDCTVGKEYPATMFYIERESGSVKLFAFLDDIGAPCLVDDGATSAILVSDPNEVPDA